MYFYRHLDITHAGVRCNPVATVLILNFSVHRVRTLAGYRPTTMKHSYLWFKHEPHTHTLANWSNRRDVCVP